MKNDIRLIGGILVFGCALLAGCGDDESEAQRAEQRCKDIVDAYGKLWEGCGVTDGRKIWAEELPCDQANAIDDAKADQCMTDLSALNCSSKSTLPSSCVQALAD